MSDVVPPPTVVVVSFDCWPWPALGCYGHEWIDTPNWDQLAAEGFLFDRCVATVSRDDRAHEKMGNDFLSRLNHAGVQTSLLTEAGASRLGRGAPWSDVQEITGNDAPAAPLAERSFAKLTAAAISRLRSPADSPRLVWVHGVGLPEPCPILREALELYAADFADEGLDLAAMTDEDLVDHELTRATLLSLLDHWLGELRTAARAVPGIQGMVVFAWEGAIWEPVPRPTPLIAPFDPQQSQVPCVVTREKMDPGRTTALVTTGDLFVTLERWFSLAVSDRSAGQDWGPLLAGDVTSVRDSVMFRDEDHGALWSADDLMLFARHHDGWATQRFLWPEDGWAVHDISFQTPDVTAERLATFLS